MEEVSTLNEVFRYFDGDNFLEKISKITSDEDIDVKEMSSRLNKELNNRKKRLENIKSKLLTVHETLKESTVNELLAKIDDELSSINNLSDSLSKMLDGEMPFSQSNLQNAGEEINHLFDLEESLNNSIEATSLEYRQSIADMIKEDPSKVEELRDLANQQEVQEDIKEDIEDTIDVVDDSNNSDNNETQDGDEDYTEDLTVSEPIIVEDSEQTETEEDTKESDEDIQMNANAIEDKGLETIEEEEQTDEKEGVFPLRWDEEATKKDIKGIENGYNHVIILPGMSITDVAAAMAGQKLIGMFNDFEIDGSKYEKPEDIVNAYKAYREKKAEERQKQSNENLEKGDVDLQNQQNNKTEQDSMENKEGKISLSYDERIKGINYTQGMNYSEEVHKIRVEYEIEVLESELKNVEKTIKKIKSSNKKVPFKVAVEQQRLLNQINELKNENLKIELNRKEARREKDMSKTQSKIDDQTTRLENEQLKYSEAKSKLFKGISLRKEKKIQEKLALLNGKMSVFKEEQITSTEMKFDKENKKIIKLAKKNAKKEVINQRIEELKAYRDSLVREAKAIGSDVARFVSKSQLIQKLKESKVQFNGAPTIIELPEEELETSMVRAA